MTSPPDTAVLVVAAGRGLRVGSDLPKQYLQLAGRALLTHTLSNLLKAEARVLVVIHPDDGEHYARSVADLDGPQGTLLPPVPGGATRQDSVRLGLDALAALPEPPRLVLIHDGARPFPSPGLMRRAISAAEHNARPPRASP